VTAMKEQMACTGSENKLTLVKVVSSVMTL